jgi:hypothetical protein
MLTLQTHRYGVGNFLGGKAPHLPVFAFCIQKMGEYGASLEQGKSYPPCMLDDFHKLSVEKPEFRPGWGNMWVLFCSTRSDLTHHP